MPPRQCDDAQTRCPPVLVGAQHPLGQSAFLEQYAAQVAPEPKSMHKASFVENPQQASLDEQAAPAARQASVAGEPASPCAGSESRGCGAGPQAHAASIQSQHVARARSERRRAVIEGEGTSVRTWKLLRR